MSANTTAPATPRNYGEIFDRGYLHYDGPRLGIPAAIWALARYSMARAIGIRRPWTAKIIPFLIYALAALGLNLLTGYAGQVSLGTGGFMAVGAYSAFKLSSAFPGLNVIVAFVLAGLITALVGLVFGIPSLRIKGFYLAVATLAAQFFLVWLFNKVPLFFNYSATGQINAPTRTVMGFAVTGAEAAPWASVRSANAAKHSGGRFAASAAAPARSPMNTNPRRAARRSEFMGRRRRARGLRPAPRRGRRRGPRRAPRRR